METICVIKNSIIMNDVYIGDNAVIENCIVESRGTIEQMHAISQSQVIFASL